MTRQPNKFETYVPESRAKRAESRVAELEADRDRLRDELERIANRIDRRARIGLLTAIEQEIRSQAREALGDHGEAK